MAWAAPESRDNSKPPFFRGLAGRLGSVSRGLSYRSLRPTAASIAAPSQVLVHLYRRRLGCRGYSTRNSRPGPKPSSSSLVDRVVAARGTVVRDGRSSRPLCGTHAVTVRITGGHQGGSSRSRPDGDTEAASIWSQASRNKSESDEQISGMLRT
jgi:hypothetical protein